MAANGQEVEIKVPVSAHHLHDLERDLRARFGEPRTSHQCDSYYTPSNDDYTGHPFPFKWLSVRVRGDQTSINFKHFHPEGAERHTHADEVDLKVTDPKEAHRLLVALGFEPLVAVDKTRSTIVDPAGYEVALDTVRNLGHFVEVEATRDFGGPVATHQAVVKYASSLGLDVTRADNRGYPYHLIQRRRAAHASSGR